MILPRLFHHRSIVYPVNSHRQVQSPLATEKSKRLRQLRRQHLAKLQLPPAMISLPFKILLFVLIDGWHLVVGSLVKSFL